MENSCVLQAVDLDLGYGNNLVLNKINFSVAKGDFWFFLGPNGAGKTTLLRAMIGTLAAKRGSIGLSAEIKHNRSLALIPQKCVITDTLPMTVREFVLFGLTGLRLPKSEQTRRLLVALEQTGLQSLIADNYWTLSGGQRQRALVARALIRQPKLLILDEATEGLDLNSKTELLRTVSEANKESGLTVIFVTHDLAIAAKYGNRFALFANRSIISGEGAATLTRENLELTYGLPISICGMESGNPELTFCQEHC